MTYCTWCISLGHFLVWKSWFLGKNRSVFKGNVSKCQIFELRSAWGRQWSEIWCSNSPKIIYTGVHHFPRLTAHLQEALGPRKNFRLIHLKNFDILTFCSKFQDFSEIFFMKMLEIFFMKMLEIFFYCTCPFSLKFTGWTWKHHRKRLLNACLCVLINMLSFED